MASLCRVCEERPVAEGKDTCWDCCPESDDGKHYADVSSIHWIDTTIFDILCKFCGQCGSLSLEISNEDICW